MKDGKKRSKEVKARESVEKSIEKKVLFEKEKEKVE